MVMKRSHSDNKRVPAEKDGFAGKPPLGDGLLGKITKGWLNPRLFKSVRNNDIEAAIRALERGASANARDEYEQTPVMIAAYYGYDQMVDVLRGYGARMNDEDALCGTALMGAVDQGHHSTVKILKDSGAKTKLRDSDTSCTIRLAKNAGDWPMVRLLDGTA